MNWFLWLVSALFVAVLILLLCDIAASLIHNRKAWKDQDVSLRHHRRQHEFYLGEADEWRHRAEFAEVYAAQLEAELDVAPIDRMTPTSWRHRFPGYHRPTLPNSVK